MPMLEAKRFQYGLGRFLKLSQRGPREQRSKQGNQDMSAANAPTHHVFSLYFSTSTRAKIVSCNDNDDNRRKGRRVMAYAMQIAWHDGSHPGGMLRPASALRGRWLTSGRVGGKRLSREAPRLMPIRRATAGRPSILA